MEAAATVPIMPINELSTNLLPKRAAVGATGISTMMIAWLSMVSIGVMNVIIIVVVIGGGIVRKVTRDDEIAQQKEARNMTTKEGGGGGERSIKVHTTKTHMIPTPRTPRAKAIALLLLRRRPFRRYRTTFIGTKTKGRGRISSQKEATRRGR